MKQTYTILDVKQQNLRSMIDYARFRNAVVKKNLALDLELSFSTVSNTINDLIALGLLQQTDGDGARLVGRSPKSYTFVPERFQIMVIELFRVSEITLSMVDLQRRILSTNVIALPAFEGAEGYFGAVEKACQGFIEENDLGNDRIIGVSAVIPGVYDPERDAVVSSYNALLQGAHLKKELEERLGKPVWIENDINCAAYSITLDTGIHNLAYLFINEYIGFGAVVGGQLLRGSNGITSELAHIPLGRLDRPCRRKCPGNHCLEADLSISGYLSKYSGEALPWSMPREQLERRWKDYLEALQRGEEKAVAVMRENREVLELALCAVSSLLRPEQIVIGGMPEALFAIIKEPIETIVNARERYDPMVRLFRDEHFQQTMILGAAELAYGDWKPDVERSLTQMEDDDTEKD